MIPETMTALVLEGHGELDKLVVHHDWPTPKPGPQQVLIKVGACGLNNTDVNTRTGWYSKAVSEATTGGAYQSVSDDDPTWGGAPISFPRIQGADVVGEVVAMGAQAETSLMGKRVLVDCWLRDWSEPMNRERTGYFGSECDGGFAQYTVVDHRNVGAIDCPLSDAELATFSCSYTTAEGMLSRAQVGADDTVLVTGASGGVGSALIQLAKRRGATVVAMASEAKHEALASLGADVLLPRSVPDLGAALKATIGGDKVDVVADIVGGPAFGNVIDALRRGGRYTCSGAIAGPMVELDLRTFYLNDLTFTGSTVTQPHIFRDLLRYVEKGEVKPLLAQSYPLAEFHAAQTAFIQKTHVGNIAVVL